MGAEVLPGSLAISLSEKSQSQNFLFILFLSYRGDFNLNFKLSYIKFEKVVRKLFKKKLTFFKSQNCKISLKTANKLFQAMKLFRKTKWMTKTHFYYFDTFFWKVNIWPTVSSSFLYFTSISKTSKLNTIFVEAWWFVFSKNLLTQHTRNIKTSIEDFPIFLAFPKILSHMEKACFP